MGQYLIDTNSVSNYLSELFPGKVMDFLDKVTDQIPNISVITEIEILSWKTTEEVENIVKSFTSDSNIHDITPQIVKLCVELRQKKTIKLLMLLLQQRLWRMILL